jgi:hypothetical protein
VRPCPATIEFGDDLGHNVTTFRCRLGAGHAGPHGEKGDKGWGRVPMPYTLTWEGSEAEVDAQFGPEEGGHAPG